MKKLFKISALAVALLLMIFTLAACAGPADDADDARRALKENSYDVKYYEKGDTYLNLLTSGFDVYGLEEMVVAYDSTNRESAQNFIVIFYFDESEDARESMSAIYKIIDVLKAEMVLSGFDPDHLNPVIEESDDLIWWGTEDAAKAAK